MPQHGKAVTAKRVRLLMWIVWPAAIVIVGLGFLHFVRDRLGWGIYWSWSPRHLLQVLLVVLGPAAAAEVLLRKARNHG
jgi:hypothetical protein